MSCRIHHTCELLYSFNGDELVSLSLEMMTVRVMRGSATESKLLPVTVTSVPPLYTVYRNKLYSCLFI